MRREANFQTLFRHWIKANPMGSAAFELKQTTTDSIPFSAVKEHQIAGLMATKKGLLFKLPDDSRGIKPFDFFYLLEAVAYVVIRFPDFFVLIEVNDFAAESDFSTRRSLTSERAKQIASRVVPLHKP